MKYQVIVLFFICSVFGYKNNVNAHNQAEIDSVKAIIAIEENNEKLVDNYNIIADLYSINKPDSAIYYALKSLNLAQQIIYSKGEAESRFQLSYYYDRAGEVEQAIMHLEKASDFFVSLGDSSYLSGCYNNLGVYYSYGTEQKKSLEYFIKALNSAESLKDTFALSEAYYNIGTFYEFVSEYALALQYYQKSLEIDTLQGNYNDISWSFINLGNINMNLKRFDDAYIYYKKARNSLNHVNDQYYHIQLNLSFAYYFIEQSQLDSVQVYIEKAKETYRNHTFERLEPDILAIEADYLLAKNQFEESIKLYDEVIRLYKEQESTGNLSEIYSSKAKALENIGELDKAYMALLEANKIYDEFKIHEIAKVLGEFEQKQDSKEQLKQYQIEQELLAQKQQTDLIKIRSKFRYAILSIVFLVILAFLGLYLYTNKRKNHRVLEANLKTINQQKILVQEQNQKLEESRKKLSELNATKDKFFSILAHDLKNPFNVLIGLSEVILNNKEIRNSDEFDELMEGMYKTASSGYNLLENLLEWSRSQTGNIEHHPQSVLVADIVSSNIHLFQETLKEKKIEISIKDIMNYNVYADSNMVNFIVRNLLNNAIKFSHPGGKIELSFQQKDNFIFTHIQDYGIGMNQDTIDKLFKIDKNVQRKGTSGETGTGLGLILCQEFVYKNKGEIWVESSKDQGSRFSFSLPVYNQN